MTRRHVLVIGCVLGGCSLQTSFTGPRSVATSPSTTSSSNSTNTSSSSSASSTAASDDTTAAADAPRPGYVDCSDRAEYMRVHRESCDPKEPIIVGLSVDDARKKLAALGFTGSVKVTQHHEFDAACKADHVCGFEPRRWYVENRVTFYINRKLAIGTPD